MRCLIPAVRATVPTPNVGRPYDAAHLDPSHVEARTQCSRRPAPISPL